VDSDGASENVSHPRNVYERIIYILVPISYNKYID